MAGALYDKGREAFLGVASGSINWINDEIKAVLVSSSYSPNLATHQFLPSVDARTGSLTAQVLASKTATAGVADAADVTFTAVPVGMVIDYVLLFKNDGKPNTSPLIALIDSGSATGLPLTGSGADVSIVWSNGSNKIFKL